MIIAAATHSTGLPLWVVCTLAFIAMLTVGLVLLLSPLAKKQRLAKQARIEEVYRYRVLGAYQEDGPEAVTGAPAETQLTVHALGLLDKLVRARGKRERMVVDLEAAGLRMRPEEWAGIQIAAIVVLGAAGALAVGVIGLVLGAVLGALACRFFVRLKTSRRLTAFETQLPDALQLLAGALRTGFALNQAIATVVREGTDPVSTEFGRALQEVRLGTNLEDALDGLAERMHSYDMQLVSMSVRTAREVGGNLAEVLQTTTVTMRERVQLRGQVKTLTAEGRISAKVLVALPILMATYLLLFKKSYLVPLYTTGLGIAMITGGVALLVVGCFWLSRLTKIEV